MKKRTARQTFSIKWILLVALLPIFAAWFLVPKDLQMAERFAEDGHPQRSLDLLKDLIPREISTPIKGRRGEWEFTAMEALLSEDGKMRKRGGKKTRMLRILVQVSETPEDVFGLCKTHAKALKPDIAKDFLRITSTTALRQNKPKLASNVYHYLESEYGMDGDYLMDAVMAHRYSGSPRLALELLYNNAKRKGVEVAGLAKEERMLIIALHRELNEGPTAFALLRKEFDRAKTDSQRQELVELLATTATQSNMFEESLPILQDHLSKTQAAQLSWQELSVRKSGHSTDSEFVKYGTTMAQQYLWSGQLHSAFDMYRKLALFDSGDSLDTCVEMTPWVNRKSDLGELLGAVDPLPAGKGYEKIYIESLCIGGKFEAAEQAVNGWIDEGKSFDESWMLLTLADLSFEQRRYKQAQNFYGDALASAEKSGTEIKEKLPILTRLAQTATINQDFVTALDTYRVIPGELHTLKTIEDYLYLSKSMNATDDIISGTRVQAKQFGEKGDSLPWLNMAAACQNSGRFELAEKVLKEGRAACPESRKIILKQVENLIKQSRDQDALQMLLRDFVPDDPRFRAKLLSLAVTTKREDEVLAFLGVDGQLAKDWPVSSRLSLAQVFEAKLKYDKALAIYQDVDPGGFKIESSRIKAQIAFKAGKIEEAWELYSGYMKLKPTPSYEDLVFMGDLHRFTGRTQEANFSYSAALRRLNKAPSSQRTKPKDDSNL